MDDDDNNHDQTHTTEPSVKARLWNPLQDTRSPSEDEFEAVEASFGRFVNFLKHRDEAGLSPDSVRLLHNFYSNLGSDCLENPARLEEVLHPDMPVNQLANNFSIRKSLEGRHLSVLINLLMVTVEEEQNELKRLLRFYEMLASENSLPPTTPSFKLDELKALTQEHIRLKIDFIAKLKSGRALMVKGFEGSQRLLAILRKNAAKHARKQHLQELAKIREELEPPQTKTEN